MKKNAIKNLAKLWLSHDMEAFGKVYDLTSEDPEKAWPIVLELFNQASNDKSLARVAAGPLEDIICNFPSIVISRVLDLAKKDARFRKCLKAVWGGNRMPSEIKTQINGAVAEESPW